MSAYKFEVAPVTEACVAWIREWFAQNGGEKPTAVIGISGGKDSAVVAALCAKALGKDNLVAVLMPNGEQKDIGDSWTVIKHLGLQRVIYANISETFKALQNCIMEFWTLKDPNNPPAVQYIDSRTGLPMGHVSKTDKLEPMKWSEGALINTPARLRMTTLYAVAASVGGRVLNTCNRSEDAVGWSTLYGDTCGDLSPLSRLTVTEVIAMGEYLGLPREITRKTPSDGLCGKSDEEGIGLKYVEIDEYLREYKRADTVGKRVVEMYLKRGKFKLDLITLPSFVPPIYGDDGKIEGYLSDYLNNGVLGKGG